MAERLLAMLGDGVICVSEEEREHALTLGIRPERCFVVHNGLAPLPPADREEIRRDWGVESDAVCAGFVGRLSEQKAVERLVEAFAVVYANHPKLHLVIVGDGPNADDARRLVERLGIADRTIFTGTANGAEQMAGLDLYAMASRYEAFPYVLIESVTREVTHRNDRRRWREGRCEERCERLYRPSGFHGPLRPAPGRSGA